MAQNITVKYIVDDSQLDDARRKLGLQGDAFDALTKDVDQAGAAARKAGSEMAEAGRKGKAGAAEASKGFDLLGSGVRSMGGLIAGAFALDRVLSFGKAVVDATAKQQAFTAALTTMLGSKEKADALSGQLVQLAATTPFELTQVQDAARKLLAFGVAAADVAPTLRRLGDVAAGVGAPVEEIAELFGKAKVQGRLFAEDINQFQGRGIPIVQELAKVMGVAETNIRGLVEKGKIGFPELEKAFVNLTAEGGKFAGLMEAQSKTLGGQISNLSDSFGQLFVAIGEQGAGTFSSLVTGATAAVTAIKGLVETAESKSQQRTAGRKSELLAEAEQLTTVEKVQRRLVELTYQREVKERTGNELLRLQAESTRGFAGAVDGAGKALLGGALSLGTYRTQHEKLAKSYSLNRDEAKAYDQAIAELTARQGELAKKEAAAATTAGSYIAALQLEEKELQRLIGTVYTKLELEGAEGQAAVARVAAINEEIRALTTLEKVKFDAAAEQLRRFGQATKSPNLADPNDTDLVNQQLDLLARDEAAARQRRLDGDAEAKANGLAADRAYNIERAANAETYYDKLRILAEAGLATSDEYRAVELEQEAAFRQQGAQLAIDAANLFLSVRQQQLQQELSSLQGAEAVALQLAGDNEKAKARIKNEFAAKERAAKKQLADNEKLQAVFSIGLSTTQAVMATLKQFGGTPLGYGLAFAVGAFGAAQVALTLSKKPPAYARGTRFVEGPGTGTSDSVPALLSRGERVLTAERNRAYGPALDAIHDGSISPYALNQLLADFQRYGAPGAGVVVPLAGGAGGADPAAIGRAVAEHIGDRLGLSVVIDGDGVRAKRGRRGAWDRMIRDRYSD